MARRRLENAHERLQDAALALFAAHGVEATGVVDISAAADVSPRTFFRYFKDKHEVVFFGQERLGQQVVADLERAEASDPVALMHVALQSAASFFPVQRRVQSRTRAVVIASDQRLRERELLKLARLSQDINEAFVRRGIEPTTASLAAESTVTIFRTAHALWIAPAERREMGEIQDELMGLLSRTVGGPQSATAGRKRNRRRGSATPV